ncbi:GNAT family N-acetyltransferase [Spongiactinospora sp. TRM90649]|uniref:GNAT family N-acetyltransferase n=1 Tax=Spongiactinospora sp. TRM90649 TaxID=3031114 RepID=UPI0023F7975F|nr:GNAT family N-acetyltransferase [Spongiactinospora sp. TRM90649]MDF5752041.1 GNAT family N-acetyltransferase [Spongiactinospora sp. TRM90649]
MTVRPSGDLGALAEVAAVALDFDPADAHDAHALVARLSAPPSGRVWTSLASDDGLVFASLSGKDPTVGHIDLIGVRPEARGRGLGTRLVRAAEEWLRDHGAEQGRFAGNPPCYAWPGIDVRATPAVCLAESLGYERYHAAWNMTADLAADLGVEAELARLAEAGVTVRSAAPGERAQVVAFAREHWKETWAWEAEHATGCHYAVRGDEVIGFAVWGSRPSWFGPTGTAAAARGLGVGRVLLRRCLAEQRDSGLTAAQIAWVGPLRFYARAVGARVERVFWLYRRDLR